MRDERAVLVRVRKHLFLSGGDAHLEQAAEARGITIEWRPFLLGPILAAQGWNDSPFNPDPAKGLYMRRDLEWLCASHALSLRRPSRFPRNGLLAALIACVAEEGHGRRVRRAVYRASSSRIWTFPPPRHRPGARGADQPGTALIERSETEAPKARLRARTDEAQRLGIFGAPSFVVAGELFWGNDRLDDALDWVQRRGA